jgi:CxxC motif-containing protein (DUF1111 family)
MKIRRSALALFLAGAPIVLAFALEAPSGSNLPPVGSPGGPSRPLTPSEAKVWLRGRDLFDHDFHKSDGLGTFELNADSCRACHGDPAIGGAGGLDVNVSRFGFDNNGAGPFQNLPGGQVVSKLRPPFADGREEYDVTADVFEQRQTPTLFGAGLIDSIPEAEILLNEDPDDLDGDGVSGVARRINVGGEIEIGRFGWKAQVPRLRDFIKDAMGGENGITTEDDGRGFAFLTDLDPVPDAELSETKVDDMLFFLSNLAPPARGGSLDPMVISGEMLFEDIGCATCHVPELQGASGPVPLYSDLLIHKIMAPDFRGVAEPGAKVGHYRTPPLWGVSKTAPYMHDGRSENLATAIRAHDGEAIRARQAFDALAPLDREALLAFLADL